MKTALQYTDFEKTRQLAEDALEFLSRNDGFIGGRILEPSPSRPLNQWFVQVFFEDEPAYENGMIDGLRRVMIPDSQLSTLGIRRI